MKVWHKEQGNFRIQKKTLKKQMITLQEKKRRGKKIREKINLVLKKIKCQLIIKNTERQKK